MNQSTYKSNRVINSSISSQSRVETKEERLTFLSEMFPLIPIDYFNPLVDISAEELSNILMIFSNMDDNLDIMEHLSEMSKVAIVFEDDLEDVNCDTISSLGSVDDEEESMLMDIELEENVKCLSLGRMFLKQAHSKFSKLCGTSDVDIESIPPEISEMNWCPSEDVMLTIYRAFMTDLGIIEHENSIAEEAPKKFEEEKLSLREIIDLEQAMANSLEMGRSEIRNKPIFYEQVLALQRRYPLLPPTLVEEVFISCNMNSSQSICELTKKSKESYQSSRSKPANNYDKACNTSLTSSKILPKRMLDRIDIENKRIHHIKTKLNTSKSNGTHGYIQSYWKEELKESIQRLKWLREHDGLALVAQRREVEGIHQLDLHGLSCSSAVLALDTRFEEIRKRKRDNNSCKDLTIICGRGLHSFHGKSRLKPVVRNYLTNSNLDFSQPYDGTFRVPLRQFLRSL